MQVSYETRRIDERQTENELDGLALRARRAALLGTDAMKHEHWNHEFRQINPDGGICDTCEKLQPWDEFHWRTKPTDERSESSCLKRHTCKTCRRAKRKLDYAKFGDQIRQQA